MQEVLISPDEATTPIPVAALTEVEAAARLDQTPALKAAAAAHGFKGKTGQLFKALGSDGALGEALFVYAEQATPPPGPAAQAFRALGALLPAGDYALAAAPAGLPLADTAAAFAAGAYRFDRFKAPGDSAPARLVVPGAEDLIAARRIAAASALVRDLVNTPANALGPAEIEAAARDVAARFGATIAVVVGEALIAAGYPAVHAVGAAAAAGREPRMIEIAWGRADHPHLVLVGKGVAFDTGGLDLKPSGAMGLMKKDMGGAAHALALGQMVMDAGLPVRLTILIPAVENAVSGAAMRPGDVIASRKGLWIEVGNTDAEGRLILADALARADELSPALTIDLATLTGAARAALGPEVIPFYTGDDALAADLASASLAAGDPVWRMPLWRGYAASIDSDIGDLKNDPDRWAQAGSVTAALFLERFAPKGAWIHLDLYAWNPRGRPGWPVGAETQAIRALYRLIQARFS